MIDDCDHVGEKYICDVKMLQENVGNDSYTNS